MVLSSRAAPSSLSSARVRAIPALPSSRDDRASAPYVLPAVFPDADAGAHLGLRVWRSRSGALWHYRDVGKYRVTAGLPVASPSILPDLHREFTAACDAAGRVPLHFGLTGAALEFLPSGADTRSRWHLGDLPVFDLARWREEAGMPATVRAQVRRARNHGVTVVHWRTRPRDAERAALERARDAWLRDKPLPPLVFMTTPFLFEPWPREGVYAAYQREAFVGFLVASRALFSEMLRVDAVVRAPGAPNGTAEMLVATAFRDAAARGLSRATLGLAPLSRRSPVRQRTGLRMLSEFVRRMGCPLYSFMGLEAFKAKFAPVAWLPLYAIAPRRAFGLREVLAVARAFAGGSVARYGAQVLRRACTRVLRPRGR